jgi:type II secretory pathway component PulK
VPESRCGAHRGGYALLAVLWLSLGVGALGAGLWSAATRAAATSRNRVAITRAEWMAAGCLARALASIESAAPSRALESTPPWGRVDQLLRESRATSGFTTSCDLVARPVGDRLDINRADVRILRRYFWNVGVTEADADSLANLIATFLNPGPERSHTGRGPDRLLTELGELGQVVGPEVVELLGGAFATEPGPVSINHAPEVVLRILPGMIPEAVDRILQERRRGDMILDFAGFAASLSDSGRQGVLDSLPVLAAETTLVPIGWVILSRANSGWPPVSVAVETRIELLEQVPVIRRRRSWIQ